ncbi:MAG: hypothetical protein QOI12_5197 [Alphaproteobacteria bacterium]|jgi:predicted nucleic acid-binding protein|nr:hypothetical protein [Alphaproteobacteria bacterium]
MTNSSSQAFVYLDSMTFIFAIEGEQPVSGPAKMLFEGIRRRGGAGVTSELTLAEVLAGSELPRQPPTRRAFLDLLVWSKTVQLVPISREILYDSADLRFMHREAHGKKLQLLDAIHLVTAVQRRCQYFVTADKGIRPPAGMKAISPDPDGVAELLKALA